MAVELAEKQAELVKARDALNAARLSQSYTHGGDSTQRADLAALEEHVNRLSRDVRMLEEAEAGNPSPAFVFPEWK